MVTVDQEGDGKEIAADLLTKRLDVSSCLECMTKVHLWEVARKAQDLEPQDADYIPLELGGSGPDFSSFY